MDQICQPEKPIPISVAATRELKAGDQFVKAASGICYFAGDLYIVQDSSRTLAKVKPDLVGGIAFFPLAPTQRMARLEDPAKSYDDYRKERKADFESIAALADGRLLILGSGSDVPKADGRRMTFRNMAVMFDPSKNSFEEVDLTPFYQFLSAQNDFVGPVTSYGKPILNIEGLVIFEDKIALFHRANMNKNGHDAMAIFDAKMWLQEIQKSVWRLRPRSIVRFDFGTAEVSGQKFPITLSDAAYHNGGFLITLVCEADAVIEGRHIDGGVIWTGLATLDLKNRSCQTYRFTDAKLAKIEGITADPLHPRLFYAVHDVDNESAPSLLSQLRIP